MSIDENTKNSVIAILKENGINDIKDINFDELELYGSFVLAQTLLDICDYFGIDELEQEHGK